MRPPPSGVRKGACFQRLLTLLREPCGSHGVRRPTWLSNSSRRFITMPVVRLTAAADLVVSQQLSQSGRVGAATPARLFTSASRKGCNPLSQPPEPWRFSGQVRQPAHALWPLPLWVRSIPARHPLRRANCTAAVLVGLRGALVFHRRRGAVAAHRLGRLGGVDFAIAFLLILVE